MFFLVKVHFNKNVPLFENQSVSLRQSYIFVFDVTCCFTLINTFVYFIFL